MTHCWDESLSISAMVDNIWQENVSTPENFHGCWTVSTHHVRVRASLASIGIARNQIWSAPLACFQTFPLPGGFSLASLARWVVRTLCIDFWSYNTHCIFPLTTGAFCCWHAFGIRWLDPETSSNSCSLFLPIRLLNNQLQTHDNTYTCKLLYYNIIIQCQKLLITSYFESCNINQ